MQNSIDYDKTESNTRKETKIMKGENEGDGRRKLYRSGSRKW